MAAARMREFMTGSHVFPRKEIRRSANRTDSRPNMGTVTAAAATIGRGAVGMGESPVYPRFARWRGMIRRGVAEAV